MNVEPPSIDGVAVPKTASAMGPAAELKFQTTTTVVFDFWKVTVR